MLSSASEKMAAEPVRKYARNLIPSSRAETTTEVRAALASGRGMCRNLASTTGILVREVAIAMAAIAGMAWRLRPDLNLRRKYMIRHDQPVNENNRDASASHGARDAFHAVAHRIAY